MTSKAPSGRGMSVTSPCRHSIAVGTSEETLRATSSMPSFMSRPTTVPPEPTRCAAGHDASPASHVEHPLPRPRPCEFDQILRPRCEQQRHQITLVCLGATLFELPPRRRSSSLIEPPLHLPQLDAFDTNKQLP